MKSTQRHWDGACSSIRATAGLEGDGLFDHDVVFGHVVVEALAAGFDSLDLVHHVSAGDDLAKHGVAPALCGGRGVVQKAVVGHVDEELGGGRVGVAGAGHGHGVVGVLQAVVGFVLDRRVAGLLVHARLHAAALDHEARNDAVKNGVVVVALVARRSESWRPIGGLCPDPVPG